MLFTIAWCLSQDKDSKVAYLTKLINFAGLALEMHCPAKPLKIVAGLEPENTNIMLQVCHASLPLGR